MCVQIDCLFLMPGFEYGSDFEIKISGVGDNADIRRKRGLFVSHCETGCSGGGKERGGRMKKARRLPRFFS